MKLFRLTRRGQSRVEVISLAVSILLAVPLWCQTENSSSEQPMAALIGYDNSSTRAESSDNQASDDRMLTPPPVSGGAYSTALGSERSNYLRGGLSFGSAYTDNAAGSLYGHPVSDVSYSIGPFIALDETTSRMHAVFSYAPGFTFYQRLSSLSQSDHNATISFQYRLSPHVTFTAGDGFQKTSSMLKQSDPTSSAVYGGTQGPNLSVVAPLANVLSNSGNVGLTYQFALNGMIGANGTFSHLHYPNPAQVPGLYDSSSQSGSAFYSLRVSKMHYLGATYQYQRLVSYPTGGQGQTQTHALLFFYTLFATTRISVSFFGGPQYSNTVQAQLQAQQAQSTEVRSWDPAAGASLSWQGRLTSFALSYSHMISGGGGLIGAVQMDSAAASVRQQITRTLSGSFSGQYTQNYGLGGELSGTSNGHTISGSAYLQRTFGPHLNLQLGYTRLHQNYSNVAILSLTPDTNRESISLSYQFSRPLGR
jgi:hypothetical protein